MEKNIEIRCTHEREKEVDTMTNATRIFRGYKVEHYATADSAVVYTDYCYTSKMYVELLSKYDRLIRNAGKIKNAKIPNNNEFCKIVEIRDLKSEAQKEFERRAAENYGSQVQ